MRVKSTKYSIGDLVIVRGPKASLRREMRIELVRITLTPNGQVVQYGFRESLWLYTERMIEKKIEKQTQDEFDFEGLA